MARRSGFQHQVRSRRSKDWAFGPSAVDQTLNATGSLIWSIGVQTVLGELTIIRTRGIVNVTQNVGSAAQDGMAGAHGIALVTTQAFTAGVVSIPTPVSENEWDGWLWHSFFDVRVITATIADGVNAMSVIDRQVIDSKAMRKGFDESMTLVGVTEVVEGGTASIEIHANTRVLVLHA